MPRHPARAAHLLAAPDDAESQFYEALREGDIDKMMAVWHDDDEVVCVHPGGARVVGTAAIRAAFESIFANGSIPVQPDRIRRVHSLDAAMHSVVERFEMNTPEGRQSGSVVATNVYLKTAEGWRMVLHHASPGSAGEPVEVVEAPSVLH
ncbi:ketosteroid isomerase-like enzyme [Burkholderiales bacterium JOSHI_001]|nr:ketosteroid isomerase-like enzyme [Burkholderiales bacterium JOSHI_001]